MLFIFKSYATLLTIYDYIDWWYWLWLFNCKSVCLWISLTVALSHRDTRGQSRSIPIKCVNMKQQCRSVMGCYKTGKGPMLFQGLQVKICRAHEVILQAKVIVKDLQKRDRERDSVRQRYCLVTTWNLNLLLRINDNNNQIIWIFCAKMQIQISNTVVL